MKRILACLTLCAALLAASTTLIKPACHHSGKSTVSATVQAEPTECRFMKAANQWKQWRARNPNAPSRFPHAPKTTGVTATFGSAEPEPDPSGEECGCGYWTALVGGCGLLHMWYSI